MKLLQATLAAALALSSLGIGGAAIAQGMHNDQGRGDHDRGDRGDRGDRNEHRGYNDNRGRHNGWSNNRGRQVCRTEWRHHHRERVCRWVRR